MHAWVWIHRLNFYAFFSKLLLIFYQLFPSYCSSWNSVLLKTTRIIQLISSIEVLQAELRHIRRGYKLHFDEGKMQLNVFKQI